MRTAVRPSRPRRWSNAANGAISGNTLGVTVTNAVNNAGGLLRATTGRPFAHRGKPVECRRYDSVGAWRCHARRERHARQRHGNDRRRYGFGEAQCRACEQCRCHRRCAAQRAGNGHADQHGRSPAEPWRHRSTCHKWHQQQLGKHRGQRRHDAELARRSPTSAAASPTPAARLPR